jgi:hypothetical protein
LHYLSGILTVVTFLIYSKSLLKNIDLLCLAVYSFLDVFLNFLNFYTKSIDQTVSLYVWSVFTLIEYGVFTYMLWSNIKSKTFQLVVFWLSIIFIAFTVIYNLKTNFKDIDSVPIGIETILLFIYSFWYLYEQMSDTSVLFVYSKYQFWVILGFLIYLAGSFFFFILASKWGSYISKYWYLTNIFYVFMNLMFIIAFYIRAKQPKKVPLRSMLILN